MPDGVMSETLLDLIDDMVDQAIEDGVSWRDLSLAAHDQYIDADVAAVSGDVDEVDEDEDDDDEEEPCL